MKKIFAILPVMIAVACNNQEKDPVEVCPLGFKPTSGSEVKNLDSGFSRVDDPRTVRLLLKEFHSPSFPQAKSVADSALHIASVLLSSSDFKAVITGMDFTCRNYGRYCSQSCKKCTDRFSGSVVMDSVFREKEVHLDLFLNKCSNEYGHSTRNIREIYSCQSVVFYDEKKLSAAYCYAYHIAHEYMHIVGFFHTNYKDDVAERTGWIGWEILLRWRQAGINVMELQPGQR